MKTVYIVTVDKKISQLAYETLAEAQEFVKRRCDPANLEGQGEYYNVFSTRDFAQYRIEDVKVASGL